MDGEQMLPYSVAKVSGRYEAWHRHRDTRGGWWGGEILGVFDDPQDARQACVAHANGSTPSPCG